MGRLFSPSEGGKKKENEDSIIFIIDHSLLSYRYTHVHHTLDPLVNHIHLNRGLCLLVFEDIIQNPKKPLKMIASISTCARSVLRHQCRSSTSLAASLNSPLLETDPDLCGIIEDEK